MVDDDDRSDWPDGPDVRVGVCEGCGEERPIRPCVDPFVGEGIVPGDPDARVNWCRACFYLRSDEV